MLRRRREWFERHTEAPTALWWVPTGHIPTVAEALDRLATLRADGPVAAGIHISGALPGALSGFESTQGVARGVTSVADLHRPSRANTGEAYVSSDIVGPLERASDREEIERRSLRAFAIESLGPITILGGVVWAIFQPYRVVFFDHAGKGFYDYLVQPPLLVIGVGLLFALVIAPGLLDDLRSASAADDSQS